MSNKTLSQYCSIGSSKRIFSRETSESGIPFYRGREITDLSQGKKPTTEKYITVEKYKELKKKYYMPQKGDILITAVGTIGNVWQVDTDEPFYYQDSISILIYNFSKNVYPEYIYYFLKSKKVQEFFLMSITNSVQKKLTIALLKNLPLNLPNYSEQKNKTKKLLLIDKKIRINKEIIDILNKKMMLEFKYWFNNFEFPDKEGKAYKSNGGKFEFNNKLNFNIPLDWKVGILNNSKISRIVDVGIDEFKGSKYYFSTSDIIESDYYLNNKITFDTRESRANMQPLSESVWFAKMKNSVKHISFISDSNLLSNVILSTGFTGIEAINNSFAYIHCVINSQYFEHMKDMIATGSTQSSITNSTLKYINLLIPDNQTISRFNEKYKNYIGKIYQLREENTKLRNFRDFLINFL